MRLGNRLLQPLAVVDAEVRDRDVERVVLERQVLRVALVKVDDAMEAPRLREHFGREVETGSVGAAPGGFRRRSPGSAGDIENAHAAPRLCGIEQRPGIGPRGGREVRLIGRGRFTPAGELCVSDCAHAPAPAPFGCDRRIDIHALQASSSKLFPIWWGKASSSSGADTPIWIPPHPRLKAPTGFAELKFALVLSRRRRSSVPSPLAGATMYLTEL